MMIDGMFGDYGNSMGWGMAFFGLLFWGLAIVGLIALIRWMVGSNNIGTGGAGTESPLEVLNRRYASGEIDKETWSRMKKELHS